MTRTSKLTTTILGGGALASAYLLRTAPTTNSEERERPASRVTTLPLKPTKETIYLEAYGEVIPAARLTVRAEVGGRIVSQHPAMIQGGRIRAGEELFQIDPADYQLALTDAKAALEEARFEVEVEAGRQVIAAEEWQRLQATMPQDMVNRSLVLREPFKRRAQAQFERAENAIEKAQLDLNRTRVTAPFDAIVLNENIEQGQLVSPGGEVCTLVGIDEFHIRASIPMESLQWLRLPNHDSNGSKVLVRFENAAENDLNRDGEVVRILADVDPAGRMARIIIRVSNPMSDLPEMPPLLLGSFVRLDIKAGSLDNVLTIPRLALREGNRIWTVDANNTLHVHTANILWTRHDNVLIHNDFTPDDKLIISDLPTAIPGMRVSPQPFIPTGIDPSPTTETVSR